MDPFFSLPLKHTPVILTVFFVMTHLCVTWSSEIGPAAETAAVGELLHLPPEQVAGAVCARAFIAGAFSLRERWRGPAPLMGPSWAGHGFLSSVPPDSGHV